MNVLQQSNCETRRWVARVPQHGEAATGAGTGSHDIIGNQGISAHYFRPSLEGTGFLMVLTGYAFIYRRLLILFVDLFYEP